MSAKERYPILLSLIVMSVVLLKECEAARILAVFPTPSISHQVVFRPLTQELVRRGHEVVVVTTDPAFPKGHAPANLTEIDVHDVSYNIWQDVLKTPGGKIEDLLNQFHMIATSMTKTFEAQMTTEDIQKLINNKEEKFDLLLIEMCARPALVFSHIFKAPVIHISSFGAIYDAYQIVGAPTHWTLYPPYMRMKLTNVTKFDKLKEVLQYFIFNIIFPFYDKMDNEMMKRIFGKDTPEISELTKNIEMVFLNIHPVWEGNYPVPPAMVYIWGIHQKPVKELPEDLKSHLDSAKNGVIYMSFGTNTDPSLLPPEKKQILFKVLSESPYEVLWKWNSDDVPGHAKNIRYSKWFPQTDILRHPNVKLFITQGGMQSTDETISAGVPVIGIPMLGDQWYNVERYVQFGIGVKLEVESLTEENFKEAIENVIGDERYRQNIIKLRSIMHDNPTPPLDKAVFWIEHVIKHSGARHLRSPAANISWAEYLALDLVAVLLGIFLTALAVFLLLVYIVIRLILRVFKRDKIKVN